LLPRFQPPGIRGRGAVIGAARGERRAGSAPILQRGRRPRTPDHPHRAPPAQEASIAAAFDTIDRALKTHKPGSRRLSLLILVLGLAAVAMAVYLSPDRRRRRAADRLSERADTTLVLRALGPRPTRCPPGAMEHVAGELALEPAEADSVMLQLRRDTRARWLYPGRRGCTPEKGETELGIDSAGRTLWIQPGAQRGEVKLSPSITY
jgi:hypothetical protein